MGWRLGGLLSPHTGANGHRKDDDDLDLDMLPTANGHHHHSENSLSETNLVETDYLAPEATTTATTHDNPDKIPALDGLRGLACLIVYNYHFLWPWTPMILLGYGARPPLTPAPYTSWLQLPIVCLAHRGRPMVAIFFAISGYVVCRHVLRLVAQRRVDEAYRRLATAAFRRVFRLYIPATLSMLAVAVLAQAGAFKSEFDVYKGPDSVYVNGSVGTFAGTVAGWQVTGVRGSIIGTEGVSIYMSPTVDAGGLVFGGGADSSGTGFRQHPSYHYSSWSPPRTDAELAEDWSCDARCPWIRLGGMWEEHPVVFDSLRHAATGFVRTWLEWANPFTFNPYHTRYDPHTYTMPMELRGSLIMYVFLLATAHLAAGWRVGLGAMLALHALRIGRWEVATFLGGMVLSDVDVRWGGGSHAGTHARRRKSNDRTRQLGGPQQQQPLSTHRATAARILRYLALVTSLYLLSYPDTHAESTPGFRSLAAWTPRYYPSALEKWRFWHSVGALLFLPAALRTRFLARRVLESRPALYLGRVSFAFYLVHGPVLHSVGFWIMPRLFDAFGGRESGQVNVPGLLFGWVLLGLTSLLLADVWYWRVDVWSVGVARRAERFMGGGDERG
ncbi:acyltransferase family protein [Microdochium nivale]|nr:acyltransferase family protein [Microdochium nivale]